VSENEEVELRPVNNDVEFIMLGERQARWKAEKGTQDRVTEKIGLNHVNKLF
jgi:hypothetical protein